MRNKFLGMLWELAMAASPELAIVEIGQTRFARRHPEDYYDAAHEFIRDWDNVEKRTERAAQ